MEFNFPRQHGKGIGGPYMKHASKQCSDLITQLCAYDPDERLTAKQALRHPYFKDLRCSISLHLRVCLADSSSLSL